MNRKIIISGKYIDTNDFDHIEAEDDLAFSLYPKLSELSQSDIHHLQSECHEADLIIVALFGSDARSIDKLQLGQISVPKALWSFDSHHQWVHERLYQDVFDRIFVSHSPYMKFFDQQRVEWCPCCFVRYGVAGLKDLLTNGRNHPGYAYDVVFPFKPHPIGSRNSIAAGLNRKLRERNVKYYLGPVESGKPYMQLVMSSRVTLNLSLTDDLNIRNFEVWGLNRILLTNKTPDHSRLQGLPDETIFFNRDLSDLDAAIEIALARSKKTVSSSDYILNHHMQIHRYVEIINKTLNTDYTVRCCDGRAT